MSVSTLTSENPLQRGPSALEKLIELADEIKDSIRSYCTSLSNDSHKIDINIPRKTLDIEIQKLQDESLSSRLPEITFVTLLFRKFADISNAVKYAKLTSKNTDNYSNEAMLNELPKYLYEGSSEQLVGWSAMNKNIFWLRAVTALFGFLSFVIMSTVPHINDSKLYPVTAFAPDCSYKEAVISGYFDYDPFEAVIAAGVLVYLNSIFFLIYYILPVDANNHKYIPGLENIFEKCFNRDQILTSVLCVSSFCKNYSKFVEVVHDGILLVIVVVICLVTSILIERGSRFDFGIHNNMGVQYYTIETFFNTFSHTSPMCVDSSPAPLIRAALSMLYIDLFFLAWCFIVSFKSAQKTINLKSVDSSALPSGEPSSHLSRRSMHKLLEGGDDDDEIVEVSL